MKNNIKWIIIFLLFCAICAVIGIAKINNAADSQIAEIRRGDKVVRIINLSDVPEPYEFDVTDDNGGYNRIRVERGRIAVIDADCPDKICVNQGYIGNGAVPIVCLPHKLSITIRGDEGQIDSVAGKN